MDRQTDKARVSQTDKASYRVVTVNTVKFYGETVEKKSFKASSFLPVDPLRLKIPKFVEGKVKLLNSLFSIYLGCLF